MFIYHFGEDGFFGFLSTAIPLFIIFMLVRNILLVLGGRGRRRRPQLPPEGREEGPPPSRAPEQPQPAPQQPQPGSYQEEVPQPQKGEDINTIIAKMEEKLKQRAPAPAKDGQGRLYQEGARPTPPPRKATVTLGKKAKEAPATLAANKAEGKVVREGGLYSEPAGATHREGCQLDHERGRVYQEAPSWGSEGAGLAAASLLSPSSYQPSRPRLRLKHADLAKGFLVGQILDRPRSLKPYDDLL